MDNYPSITPQVVKPPETISQLRIAGILDELSEKFLPYECKFINLNYNDWKRQVIRFNPHILFVESVWNGFKKTWRNKITINNTKLIELVNWCKENGIPTIFWNKEDPLHIFTFLGVASFFDIVFTTDMDCVPFYKRLLGHNRVGVLPFATSIQLFNPIEKFKRKDSACFAGSYYAKREERRLDFEVLADSLISNYGLDIYDRNPYPHDPDYAYPHRFQKHLQGSLPVEKIDIAYKSYKIGVTLNIVKHSSTMEARRIFELLGCNTLTVTNPCLGIKNLFGELVLQFEDTDQFQKKLSLILEDENTYNRLRLLGLRKVLQEHTYKERIEQIYRQVFRKEPKNINPKIAVFSVVKTDNDIDQIKKSFNRQTYDDKRLFLFTEKKISDFQANNQKLFFLDEFQKVFPDSIDYYCFFSKKNYYGPNYLSDLILSTLYVDVSIVGKSSHFDAINGTPIFFQQFGEYNYIDRLQADRSIFSNHLLNVIEPRTLYDEDVWFENLPCFSIDRYNFCANFHETTCPIVDDLVIDQGYSIEEIYLKSDSLTSELENYNLGILLSGEEILDCVMCNNKTLKFVEHPLNYFTFYTNNQCSQKLIIEKKIDLTNITIKNEISEEPNLIIYLNAITMGDVNFYLEYFTSENQFCGQYLLIKNSCTILPVPKKSYYCKLKLETNGIVQGMVKEIIINPKITNTINITS